MSVIQSKIDVPITGFIGEVFDRLTEMVVEVQQCEISRGIARIDPARTVEAAQTLIAMDGARLGTATGIEVRDGIDILYHWCFEPQGAVVTIKVLAARPGLEVESIANIIPAANWIEREMHDLLGANFLHHPDMRRMLLDDSWPEGVYPLRKEFDQIHDRPPLPPKQSPPDVQQEVSK